MDTKIKIPLTLEAFLKLQEECRNVTAELDAMNANYRFKTEECRALERYVKLLEAQVLEQATKIAALEMNLRSARRDGAV